MKSKKIHTKYKMPNLQGELANLNMLVCNAQANVDAANALMSQAKRQIRKLQVEFNKNL